MTISSTLNRVTFAGNGSTTVFSTSPLVFFAADDLQVYLTVNATDVSTLKTINTDYTVEGGNGSTGTVTMLVAPPSGQTLVILRVVAFTQPTDLVNNSTNDAEVTEDALDRLTMLTQQINDTLGRALTLAPGSLLTGQALPAPSALKYLRWNAAATGLENTGLVTTGAIVTTPFSETVIDDGTANAMLTTITATRAETGAVAVPVLTKLRERISVKDFGAVGDGVANDRAAFDNAQTAAAGQQLLIPEGTYLINTAVTMGSTVELVFEPGAKIKPATSVTVTLSGRVLAGRYQVFDLSNASAAIAGLVHNEEVFPEWWGAVADGTTDNKAVFDKIATQLTASTPRRVKLDIGTYRFSSKPNDFTTGVQLVGQGMSNTVLERNYTAGGINEGFLTWSGSGSNNGGIESAMVRAVTGTSSGTMLKFVTGAGDVAGYHYANEVVVTFAGTGTYERCLLVDGVLNVTSGSQGLRDFRLSNCYLFHGNSGTENMRFINATNLATQSVWCNGLVVVTGGGTALSNTIDAQINIINLGQLFMSECSFVHATGVVDTLNFSTNSSSCSFHGRVVTTAGGVSNTGTSNFWNTYKEWTTYTPTVTAGSGTFTTVAGTGRYMVEGRLVHVQIEVVITTNGTAATSVNATLPIASPNISTVARTLAGREVTSTGFMLQGTISANSSTCVIRNYDNTYPGASGRTLHVSGSYEIA
jgi:hypothetical protein